jgi:hypothetical protein
VGVIGLMSPTVGLMRTTELAAEGQSIGPSVSDTAAMLAAAATPDRHGMYDIT